MDYASEWSSLQYIWITRKWFIKPRSYRQQCRSNIVECYKSNDSFYKVECRFDKIERCFDMAVVFGNDVERSFVLYTKSKQIEHVQFVSILSKGRNFTINSFDIVAVFGNKFERCFDIVACCFDVFAGVGRRKTREWKSWHQNIGVENAKEAIMESQNSPNQNYSYTKLVVDHWKLLFIALKYVITIHERYRETDRQTDRRTDSKNASRLNG